ncbi:MAG: hypothetical protein IKU84_04940 [Clostridia bacterium]|nr:hypothetical protein [Clostridia bacterium]
MSSFDFDELRRDLEDYYGAAAFSGMPAAFLDLSRVSDASNEELLDEASQNGFDLSKYRKSGW